MSILKQQRSPSAVRLLLGLVGMINATMLIAANSPTGKVELTTTTTYYDVQGSSVTELHPQVQERGPKSDDGSLIYAQTKYKISHSWQFEKQEGGYVITDVQVKLAIECIMPRKRPSSPAKSNPAFDNEWNRFQAALAVHEHGHVDIGMKTAEKMRAMLEKKQLFKSLDELRKYAETKIATCADEGKIANVDYDQRTKHGSTQGATLRDPKKAK